MNRTRLSRVLLLGVCLLLVLAGCDIGAAESEQIANVETILAGTPSPTNTPTITATLPPSATPTNTVGPSPTASVTPPPTQTPLPPTPTPNPALTGFGFCDQRAGSSVGRFSALLGAASASGTPAYEQLVLPFTLSTGSAPLSATASCLSAASFSATSGIPAPGAFVLRVDLPGWLRDDRFGASPLTQTLSFSDTRTIRGAAWSVTPGSPSGASLLISLSEPLPYRLTIERNPTRLVIAVARQSTLVSTSDLLRVPAGGARPGLDAPLFFLLDGEIWSLSRPGASAPLGGAANLSNSPDTETAFALSPDGSQVAFCRAAPGVDPADSALAVPSALWLMEADGSNQRPLGQAGVSCADPAFSQDGAQIAVAVDETGANPTRRVVYTVPAAGGQPRPRSAAADEWSISDPQWLADGALIGVGSAPDGRNTLFLLASDSPPLDVGASLSVDPNDPLSARYRSFGAPLVSPDGTRMAVEALRADRPGTDLLLLDARGALLDTIGAQTLVPPTPTPTPPATPTLTRTAAPSPTADPSATVAPSPTVDGDSTATAAAAAPSATPTLTATPEPTPAPEPSFTGPFWSRPLAWDANGQLLYLSTRCASDVAQDYELSRWSGPRRSELLGAGLSLEGLGAATSVGGGLAYVSVKDPGSQPRGPAAASPRAATTVWLWDIASGARGPLFETERGIAQLVSAP